MTTWLIQYQNVKPFWVLLQQGMWTLKHVQIICTCLPPGKSSPPAYQHSDYFTGCMPFLLANQQRQSDINETRHHETEAKTFAKRVQDLDLTFNTKTEHLTSEAKAEARKCTDYIAHINGTYNLGSCVLRISVMHQLQPTLITVHRT